MIRCSPPSDVTGRLAVRPVHLSSCTYGVTAAADDARFRVSWPYRCTYDVRCYYFTARSKKVSKSLGYCENRRQTALTDVLLYAMRTKLKSYMFETVRAHTRSSASHPKCIAMDLEGSRRRHNYMYLLVPHNRVCTARRYTRD